MDQKQTYRQICKTQPEISVFMQDKWLDIVCGENAWDVSLSFDSEEKMNGAITYFHKRKSGLKIITLPPLTPYNGIQITLPDDIELRSKQRSAEHQIVEKLISQLPPAAFQLFQFFPTFTDWLPFAWQGYRQTTRYTYLIEDMVCLERVFDMFKGSVRTRIRKAEILFDTVTSTDSASFYDHYVRSCKQNNITPPVSKEQFVRLTGLLGDNSEMVLAKKKNGKDIGAGLWLVYDGNKAYVLISFTDKDQDDNTDALTGLFWNAISRASGRAKSFDFEGSMLPNVEKVFSSFGTRQVPYFKVYKGKNRFLTAMATFLDFV